MKKYFSKIILGCAAILLMVSFGFIQNTQAAGTATVTIGSQTALNGDNLTIPVTASDFANAVKGMDFTVQYDPTLFTYTGLTENAISGHGTLSVGTTTTTVILNWFDSVALSLDNGAIVTLNFTVISATDISTNLSFVGTKELVNSTGDVIASSFANGVISLNQPQATPTFSPVAGAVALGSTVAITSAGADAIYYTTDGTNPATSVIGTTLLYSGALTIDTAKTIKAIAVKAGYADSAIGSAAYTQAVSTDLSNIALTGSPSGYTFSGSTYTYSSATVLNAVSSITVTPTGSGVITMSVDYLATTTLTSGVASAPISLTAGVAKIITITTTETGKSSKVYTIIVTRNNVAQATPTFSPVAGAVAFGTPITVTSSGATAIYYTINGTDPTTGSASITDGGTVVINSAVTLKALAVKTGSDNSAVGSALYTQAASANLTDIALSGSPSGYTFDGATYTYTGVTVLNSVASLIATSTGSGVITMSVDYLATTTLTSGVASAPISLTAGVAKIITITTTETGKSSKVYTISITRNNIQATPTFSPVAGAVAWGTPVTIISSGATAIYYTTNGDTPTTGSTNQATTPLVISSAVTVKAIAVRTGYDNSLVGSASYTQATATAPTNIVLAVGSVTPVGGVTNVAIPAVGGTDSTGAVTGWLSGTANQIKFTVTNGGSATTTLSINGDDYVNGANYGIVAASPLTIIATTTETGKITGVRTFVVSVSIPKAATPTFSPVAGATTFPTSVTITSTVGATIYYTIDGTDPTATSTAYTVPVVITVAGTLKALAVKTGYTDSSIGSAVYTLRSSRSGSSGGGISYGCKDPTALNFSSFVASNPALCRYASAISTSTATITTNTTQIVPTGYQFINNSRIGSTGSEVIELQNRLTTEGVYSGPITGNFGPLTLAAVKAYQLKKGIPQTGLVGPMTRESLNGSSTVSISQFIELLIQIGVISSDKADIARKALGL